MKTICHKFFQILEGVKFQNQNLWTVVAFTVENCFNACKMLAVPSEHSEKNAGHLPALRLGEMTLCLD